ncbi:MULTISPECIES: hypothetical protein [Asticcacaulis]|uniref:hypothetical protein n=1 Tax=Asticcacaulis TaxID=76890 RepID=UPI001AE1C5E8|nr:MULTISPECIES: hypothetical protein [Asticcacaulis]MBP2161748.1 hypothetical protein [Asticcacaulis solisilvae]MDR6802794.1 hypothetical protein [Asticcacaulis sp. BE141]
MFASNLLKFALIADAMASAAMGLLLAGGAGLLSGFLNLPQELLFYAGLFLVPYGLGVAWIGTRPQISRPLAWLVVALNGLWVADSIGLLVTDLVSPNAWGTAFVAAQALAVTVFAITQIAGLKQAQRLA